jgi:hypothetical protein
MAADGLTIQSRTISLTVYSRAPIKKGACVSRRRTRECPAIVIRLELESAPRVFADCLDDGEEARLADWLAEHPAYVRLVEDAAALAKTRRAA